MTYYLAHYIDSSSGYFAADTFDNYLRQATRADIGRPIRTYTITAQHYNDVRREALAIIDAQAPHQREVSWISYWFGS